MFTHYDHLGFANPYYTEVDGRFIIRFKFPDILAEFGCNRVLDEVAVVEILNKNYCFADRTLVRDVRRTPWMARPNPENRLWDYSPLPRHGNRKLPVEEIAQILLNKICEEVRGYIRGRRRIGILLSGGMDSRIVAGALDLVLKSGTEQKSEVTALTWGMPGSRDVVYAREIALAMGWCWKHYEVLAKDLGNNISESALHGCEYSPVHLHGIPQIRDDNDFDVVLAGSYGDSVGRAEFSGKRILDVKPLGLNIYNVGLMLSPNVFNACRISAMDDLCAYHAMYAREQKYMQNELDYQLHYMRRMLNPCMDLIQEKMSFHQVFTDPAVFGFMWSIDPALRTNEVYACLLKQFSSDLRKIPWSRTGLPYPETEGKPDEYKRINSNYIQLIVGELYPDISDRAMSDEISRLGIFNMRSIKALLVLIKKLPVQNIYYYERMAWIASLAEMVNKYGIEAKRTKSDSSLANMVNAAGATCSYMKKYARSLAASAIGKARSAHG